MKKLKISNTPALEYLDRCEKQNPVLLKSITDLWNFRYGFTNVSERYPIFAKTYVSFFQGDYLAARLTLRHRKSNACPVCGDPMWSLKAKGCSPRCATLNPEVRAQSEQTSLYRTGYLKSSQNPEVSAKSKERYKARTGYGHWSSNPEVQAKKEATNLKRSGFKFPMQDAATKDKSKGSLMKNYGVTSNWARETVRAKIKQTYLKIYGADHPMKNEDVKAKAHTEEARIKLAKTNLERYGCASTLSHEPTKSKILKTHLKRRGVPYPMMDPKVRKKSVETCLVTYGHKYPMQNSEVFHKSIGNSYRSKIWVGPDGSEHTVQGYEPQVLELLQRSGAINIVTGSAVTSFNYGRRVYHPDAMFTSPKGRNYILEVKSIYTLTKDIEVNLKKFKATSLALEGTDKSLLLAISDKDGDTVFIHKPDRSKIRNFLTDNE